MNKAVRIVLIAAILAAAVPIGAQTQSETSSQVLSGAALAAVVRECLDGVKSNIGGWCGTPDVEAHERLSDIGKPAVPFLMRSLEHSDLAPIDQFIAGVLSGICCCSFDGSLHDTLVAQVEDWWRIHGSQSEQEWILDALRSEDPRIRMYAQARTGKLTSQQDMYRLISSLKSEKKEVVLAALYTLWKNFQSEHALGYVRQVCRDGTKDQKMMALRFCGDMEIKSLSPTVAEVLKKESDYQVIDTALDAARKIHASNCIPVIEKMDEAASWKYPMVNVIRALAALKGAAYGDRVLYYLQNGRDGERMAAAEVICDCVSPKNAITPLMAALKDPDLNVRGHACISLGCSASDKSVRHRLGLIVPSLLQLFREEGEWALGEHADAALKQICTAHFGYDALPKTNGSLGGSAFSRHALPIWEEWWNRHSDD